MNAALRQSSVIGLGLAACVVAGCAAPRSTDASAENSRLKEELATARRQIDSREATIAQLNEQLRVARAIQPEDLKLIYYPDSLSIEPLSGGYNDDGKPGDDGVVVYLKPIDRDGDAIKVVGDIRIELFDLDAPGDKLVGITTVAHADASRHWYGKFGTYHYTIKCPWRGTPPRHAEITIRATFVDYLTQRVLTEQAVRRVKLAANP